MSGGAFFGSGRGGSTGFSDAVFNVVSSFLESDQARFVREVEAVEL